MRKVLVCGGRDYTDRVNVFRTLDTMDEEDKIGIIVNGGARGADTLSSMWAESRNVHCHRHHANWKRDGRGAGPIRNQKMLDAESPDIVVAFPGGSGTADMVRRARAAGVPVLEMPS